ncbi:MAG: PP2C family protein-serine/threonine phosphatase [Gemmataceae bacterium]
MQTRFDRPVTRTIGFRVALAVNLTMAIAVAGFLVFDYLRESRQRLDDKAVALREQALTVHQGVTRLLAAPRDQLQDYIDGVCGRIDDVASPGHHIVVAFDGQVLQARVGHLPDSAEVYEAVRAALGYPRAKGSYQGQELVVGHHQEEGVAVFVAVGLANLRRSIRAQVLIRSAGVLLFAAALAVAVNLAVRMVVTRPLKRLVRTIDTIGAGNLGVQAGGFRAAELSRLAEAINGMSRSLAEAEGRRKLSLARARRIQQHLLPAVGEVGGLLVAARHRPAEEVAGDYFDVLPTVDGAYLLCVADVVGHGVPAAMTAAMLKVLLLQAADRPDPPGEVLRRLNRSFMAVALPEDFASLFVAKWDPRARTLCYASAGHVPALLASGRSPLLRLESTGPLVGVSEDAAWEEASLPTLPGDLLLGLTDGVTEASNADGVMFGQRRLAELFDRNRASPPEELLAVIDRAVLDHLEGTPTADDATLVAIQFSQPPGGPKGRAAAGRHAGPQREG